MASASRPTKVLCIRIIQGDNILDKTVDPGDSVTVGESSKCTFVLPKSDLPEEEFALFRASGNGYVLRFAKGVAGRLESGGRVDKLSELLDDGKVTKQGPVAQVPLTEKDRGKIKIGSTKILFQFLPPPPAQVLKPIQAMDFRPRLMQDDDPVFLGFLLIWTAIACVMVVWVWNTEPPKFTLEDVPDRFAKVIVPEKKATPERVEEEQKEEEAAEETTGTQVEQKVEETPKPPEPVKERPPPKQTKDVETIQREAERKSELTQKSAILQMLGTTGEGKGITANLWSPEEQQGGGDLNKVLAEKAMATADEGPKLRTAKAGGNEAVKRDVKGIGGGAGGDVSGPAVTVKPRVRAETGRIAASGDENAVKSVVKRYSGQLTYCYEKRLKAVPTLEGRVEVGWMVVSGKVDGAPWIIYNGTNDAELADCITKKIRRWQFPSDVDGELSWPFAFQAKK
ncbi:MAG: AgmX/PglI C-terminal domain-containing protein [Myxococcota bacterium]